jgi:multidrug efflux pump subunit AcrB
VLAALRAQNLQVSAGILNQPPTPSDEAYQINVEALGRLSTPEQFANIIVKSDNRGRVTRVRDIGRVEIGAADYGSTAYMDRRNATALLIYAQPGANSLTVDREVVSAMQELKKDFPPGVDSIIIYDPTNFIAKSVHEVIVTIFVAILLVVGVVFLFLQSWRATIIPVIAIPVSLVGTFTILVAFGISLNNLSLFGLVLAVGIVVDDAIVGTAWSGPRFFALARRNGTPSRSNNRKSVRGGRNGSHPVTGLNNASVPFQAASRA